MGVTNFTKLTISCSQQLKSDFSSDLMPQRFIFLLYETAPEAFSFEVQNDWNWWGMLKKNKARTCVHLAEYRKSVFHTGHLPSPNYQQEVQHQKTGNILATQANFVLSSYFTVARTTSHSGFARIFKFFLFTCQKWKTRQTMLMP